MYSYTNTGRVSVNNKFAWHGNRRRNIPFGDLPLPHFIPSAIEKWPSILTPVPGGIRSGLQPAPVNGQAVHHG